MNAFSFVGSNDLWNKGDIGRHISNSAKDSSVVYHLAPLTKLYIWKQKGFYAKIKPCQIKNNVFISCCSNLFSTRLCLIRCRKTNDHLFTTEFSCDRVIKKLVLHLSHFKRDTPILLLYPVILITGHNQTMLKQGHFITPDKSNYRVWKLYLR